MTLKPCIYRKFCSTIGTMELMRIIMRFHCSVRYRESFRHTILLLIKVSVFIKCQVSYINPVSDSIEGEPSIPPSEDPVSDSSYQPLAVLCPSNSCLNGGQCLTVGSSFTCVCPLSFTGLIFCFFTFFLFLFIDFLTSTAIELQRGHSRCRTWRFYCFSESESQFFWIGDGISFIDCT